MPERAALAVGADPYLAVTLDAKRRIALVARALDLPVATLGWGYWELLEHVWERKEASVTALVLAACFGADPRIPPALVEFGFLVARAEGWELCADEAARLLGGHRQRVAAGKARATSGTRSAGGRLQRATSGGPANNQRDTSGTPADGAGKENRPAVAVVASVSADPQTYKAQKAPLQHSATATADPPGWKELVDALFAAFEADRGVKYDPSGKDWKALKGLVRHGAPEVLRRWKIGLQARYAARCSTFWDLGQRWNACAAPEANQGPSRGNSGVDPNGGIMTARRESAEEIEAANRRQEEWLNDG